MTLKFSLGRLPTFITRDRAMVPCPGVSFCHNPDERKHIDGFSWNLVLS